MSKRTPIEMAFLLAVAEQYNDMCDCFPQHLNAEPLNLEEVGSEGEAIGMINTGMWNYAVATEMMIWDNKPAMVELLEVLKTKIRILSRFSKFTEQHYVAGKMIFEHGF